MPNWVRNKVSFEGPSDKIESMLDSIKSVNKNGDLNFIDFDKIIPMPESLKIESGTSTDTGIALVKYLNGDCSELKKMLSYQWVTNAGIKTVEELFEDFKKRDNYNSTIEQGKKAIFNFENYGHNHWYSWSVDNWGTKWNAGDTSYNGGVLEFETAWSTPEPVMIELSDMNPDITFTVEYADEDIGSNCGKYTLKGGDGEYVEYDGIQACEVWGYDPAEYYPEIYRDQQIDKILGDKE
jgi:hypothetical protein